MTTKHQTSTEYFRALQIIYYALATCQILFALIVYYLNGFKEYYDDGFSDTFLYIVPAVMATAVVGSNFFIKKRLTACRSLKTLEEKMNAYRSIVIMGYAFLEVPSMLAIVSYLVTNNWLFLTMAGLMIVIFLSSKPAVEKAIRDLELNPTERDTLSNPKAIVASVRLQNDGSD